ncbi:MAG: FAD-dependent oxidoreductase [Pasteurellales bacterium]|nr:MAG: FAD-dependent oxidoreductase [Pasteurellales bacterium]
MKRSNEIEKIRNTQEWDLIVIGGGASGLGVALDGASRGFKTLLLEAKDFAKGTSSRSTKLVHGGVRYLAQGDVALVREALRERGRLAKNAPHLFRNQAFIIPGDHFWTAPYYTFGLTLYDLLAGKLSIGRTKFLGKETAKKRLSGVKDEKLQGGVCYYDGQFDDARLAFTLAQSIVDNGGSALNYCKVTNLTKDENGKLCGVVAQDEISGENFTIKCKAVVNATGVFANDIIAMDEPDARPKIVPAQGIHLVLDKEFLPGNDALMVPKTSDGRVLFAVPWHNKLVVGTTDTLVEKAEYEPRPIEQEVEFILATAKDYLKKAPTREDVRSVYVGLRPLAAPKSEGKSTKEVSRSHKIEVSKSKLIHLFGGKWTTYRQMAEDTVNRAIKEGLLPDVYCRTVDLKLHGYQAGVQIDDDFLTLYGTDAEQIRQLAKDNEVLAKPIHQDFPYIYAQIQWAVEHEAAVTLEDILARRLRLMLLDARVAKEVAPSVAEFMGTLLNWNKEKVEQEVSEFSNLVSQYIL